MSAENRCTNAILVVLTIVLVLFRRSNSTGTIMSSHCDMSCNVRNSTSTIAYNSTGTVISLRLDMTIIGNSTRRSNSTGTIDSSRSDMSCIGNSTSTIASNSTGTIVIANADSECCEGEWCNMNQ